MPGPGPKGGGGSRHKYKKEPGVDNSDEDESLDTLCDEVGMKSKSCSASDSSQVKVSSPLSSASPSPSKKPHDHHKVDRKNHFVFLNNNIMLQSKTKEREPTICLGGELASYDEVKVSLNCHNVIYSAHQHINLVFYEKQISINIICPFEKNFMKSSDQVMAQGLSPNPQYKSGNPLLR